MELITDILKVRESMWEKVQARKHSVAQVFPATFAATQAEDDGVVELMLYGQVVYQLRGAEGFEAPVDWAGYARLVKGGGEGDGWKFAYYRVYIQR